MARSRKPTTVEVSIPSSSAVASSGAVVELLSGDTTSRVTLLSGAILEVESGATLTSQTVSKGEKIAEMGDSDADSVKLHFEIRQQGKPVDPSRFLPSR